MGEQDDLTRLLRAMRSGDDRAREELVARVYPQLRRMAASYLRRERQGHTLEATALVHEGFLRLFGTGLVDWQDRVHFFAVAATQMRRILVDHARATRAVKRGGCGLKVTLTTACGLAASRDEDLIALDEALTRLHAIDPRAAQIVELRFFAGLNEVEAAEIAGVSVATLKRDWRSAKAWLFSQLKSLESA
jgi:RNA polymerase sigma factor (TIGR02999 family)